MYLAHKQTNEQKHKLTRSQISSTFSWISLQCMQYLVLNPAHI